MLTAALTQISTKSRCVTSQVYSTQSPQRINPSIFSQISLFSKYKSILVQPKSQQQQQPVYLAKRNYYEFPHHRRLRAVSETTQHSHTPSQQHHNGTQYYQPIQRTTTSSDHDAAVLQAASSSKNGNAVQPVSIRLDQSGPITVRQDKPPGSKFFGFLRGTLTLCVIGYILYMVHSYSGSGGPTGPIQEATASLHREAEPTSAQKVTFDDVCGVEEAKQELTTIVSYLKDPSKFEKIGAKLPSGILLVGPPGTGKTLLARAVAGEANVSFLYASGSDFDEIFVGSGSRRLRRLFADAHAKAPCIIFIDELDSLGKSRTMLSNTNGSVNKLLSELDGFDKQSGVVFMGATNFPDSLDRALMRPGRIDKVVQVDMPDLQGRRAILDLYLNKIKANNKDIDRDQLSRATLGFSGAQLYALVNNAAIKAIQEGYNRVQMSHLNAAFDDLIIGIERKSRIITDDTKRLTAYHEAGHAIVSYFTQGSMGIRKLTVVPRGNAAGYLSQIPKEEGQHVTKEELIARIRVAMGGRAAEELIYGEDHITSGAASDFQQATRQAWTMVTKLGMTEQFGKVYMESKKGLENMPPDVQKEVKKMLDEHYQYAIDLLKKHQSKMHRLVEELLKRETLTGDEVAMVLDGKTLPPFVLDKNET